MLEDLNIMYSWRVRAISFSDFNGSSGDVVNLAEVTRVLLDMQVLAAYAYVFLLEFVVELGRA
jgi:hypothetical protein